jgi:pyridoxine/pyridoxamine 5'-phosphate oxidase
VAACRSSSKNIGKMNKQPILNINLPWAHMELEVDVLGVVEKLVKYVVHFSKRKFKK